MIQIFRDLKVNLAKIAEMRNVKSFEDIQEIKPKLTQILEFDQTPVSKKSIFKMAQKACLRFYKFSLGPSGVGADEPYHIVPGNKSFIIKKWYSHTQSNHPYQTSNDDSSHLCIKGEHFLVSSIQHNKFIYVPISIGNSWLQAETNDVINFK